MRSAIVVENLRHPGVLKGVAEALGARHVNYGVLQQHYPAVGKALLETLKQYLQENWNPEVKVAWVYAYRGVAKLMLKGANYQSLADIDGEIETQEEEEAEIIPPKININSEIGITKYQVDSPIEIIENSFEKIKPCGE
uniref:globin domain-containing protein n=1 Tax=Okeania sp. SIO2F4 TaxID=2607790 RepID=UPI0025F0E51B|nr:globin domain-containing protein [Okeania sp. SIO2F4]